MHCNSPRAKAGLKMLEASSEPMVFATIAEDGDPSAMVSL